MKAVRQKHKTKNKNAKAFIRSDQNMFFLQNHTKIHNSFFSLFVYLNSAPDKNVARTARPSVRSWRPKFLFHRRFIIKVIKKESYEILNVGPDWMDGSDVKGGQAERLGHLGRIGQPPRLDRLFLTYFFFPYSLIVEHRAITFDFHSSRSFAFTLASPHAIPISISSFVIVDLRVTAGRPTFRPLKDPFWYPCFFHSKYMPEPSQSFVLNALT
ncbi:hypothetical protein BpHYR1_042694 [Brachionus plicatilis]|uniref:Uncharacterized protein n=1 Tax=Brachionus plicatilis TaxID=10195 RepID=A0A3M7SIE1_BRAPC|nr:hypothetical protein BpHYR1_042694 [Brachionus plicatilis]